MKISMLANNIAENTADAYSFDRYSNWAAVAEALLKRGYSEAEVVEILRSKWTRWAADFAADELKMKYGRTTSTAIIVWLEKTFMTRNRERLAVKELMEGK